jgi:hypothetical protein
MTEIQKPFQRFTNAEAAWGGRPERVRAETVETVSVRLERSTTPLKRGVNVTGVKLTKNYVVRPRMSIRRRRGRDLHHPLNRNV